VLCVSKIVLRAPSCPSDVRFASRAWTDPADALMTGTDVTFGQHVPDERCDAERVLHSAEAIAYALPMRATKSTLIGDHTLTADPGYLGHMINDCASLECVDKLAEYALAAATRACAAHVAIEGCHMATIATRDIAAGEEVFVSYGPGYWLSRGASGAGGQVTQAMQALGAQMRRGGELSRALARSLERRTAMYPRASPRGSSTRSRWASRAQALPLRDQAQRVEESRPAAHNRGTGRQGEFARLWPMPRVRQGGAPSSKRHSSPGERWRTDHTS
jgi:hypothetical protein